MTKPFPIGELEQPAVRAFADGHPVEQCLLLSIAVSLKRVADRPAVVTPDLDAIIRDHGDIELGPMGDGLGWREAGSTGPWRTL